MARTLRLDELPPGFVVPEWYKGPLTPLVIAALCAPPPTAQDKRELDRATIERSRRFAHLVEAIPEASPQECEDW